MEQILIEILSEMRTGFTQVNNRLDKVENRLDKVENRLDNMENRLVKVENRLDNMENRLDKVENRLDHLEKGQATLKLEMNERFGVVDQRFDQMDRKFVTVDQRFDQMDQKFANIDQQFATVDQRFDQMDDQFADLKSIIKHNSTLLIENITTIRKDFRNTHEEVKTDVDLLFLEVENVKRRTFKLEKKLQNVAL